MKFYRPEIFLIREISQRESQTTQPVSWRSSQIRWKLRSCDFNEESEQRHALAVPCPDYRLMRISTLISGYLSFLVSHRIIYYLIIHIVMSFYGFQKPKSELLKKERGKHIRRFKRASLWFTHDKYIKQNASCFYKTKYLDNVTLIKTDKRCNCR